MQNLLRGHFLYNTALPYGVCDKLDSPASIINQQLREIYKTDKDLFFKIFNIYKEVAMTAASLSAQQLSGKEHYRLLDDYITDIYIESFPDQNDRDELRRTIVAGADIFYPGYRKDVIDGFPEAYLDVYNKYYSDEYQRYVYEVS